MKEALLYDKKEDNAVLCYLCYQRCTIPKGGRGICAVRENRDGTLYSLVWGKPVALHVDPIEKKPFFNFHPGSRALSIATVGCNLKCLNCQNADISQYPKKHKVIEATEVSPEEVVQTAIREKCESISYTYTEPTVFFEYALDIAKLAREKGIKNTFVTNGYMSQDALKLINPYLDAANVDLKSFKDSFYKKFCGGRLEPILDNLKYMKKNGIWVEVTTLVIPTLNDTNTELEQIADFVLSLGRETPWHVSAFYPAHKLANLPETTAQMLERARDIGMRAGLMYVYTGNIPGEEGENTYCPKCKKAIIQRHGFRITEYDIDDGKCKSCKTPVSGVGL
ncbi:MAG: AmmeMemoRadiSam system radical SAM enzyme [bacterium]